MYIFFLANDRIVHEPNLSKTFFLNDRLLSLEQVIQLGTSNNQLLGSIFNTMPNLVELKKWLHKKLPFYINWNFFILFLENSQVYTKSLFVSVYKITEENTKWI